MQVTVSPGDGVPEDGDRRDETKRLREELARLRLKLEHSSDKDIRAVLQMRIAQIETELPPEAPRSKPKPAGRGPTAAPGPKAKEAEPERSETELPDKEPEELEDAGAPLTPEQAQEVDRLIRQARVEKMRNNAAEATKLLQQAATLAPASAPVLEALGDNLIERRQLMPAIKAYKRAFRLAPKNVGLEEKLANAVLRADSGGSVEDQLRRGMSDSPFLTSADIVARTPYAVFLSVLIPGAGHLALGKSSAGIGLLIAWVGCWIWLLILHTDVENLAKMIAGKSAHSNNAVFIPLFLMLVIWMGALASLKTNRAPSIRRTIDHPTPPANLPFE